MAARFADIVDLGDHEALTCPECNWGRISGKGGFGEGEFLWRTGEFRRHYRRCHAD